MNKKGQLSIINLMGWLILVIVGVVITPLITGFTAPLIADTNNTGTILLLNALPVALWLLIIGVLLMYAIPRNGMAPPMY